MKFTFYGQSCFTIELSDTTLLFDPFIKANPLASHIDINAIKADYILLSHGHADHVADAIELAKMNDAVLVSNWEICNWAERNGVAKIHPMNTGGSWDFGSFKVKCVVAQHSSTLPDGAVGGHPMGFLIFTQNGNFYYSGDTALTMDMKLIPLWADLKFCILPVGDNFTMGADDALRCAEFVNCSDVIGVHFDTFAYIKIDHEKVIQLFREAGKNLQLPQIGVSIEL